MSRILVLMLTLTISGHAHSGEPPKDFTNSIGMKFKLIPAGEFMMGSRKDKQNRISAEETQHRVRITEPYYLGVTEVTQGQWEEVMDTRPWGGHGDYAKSNPAHAVSYVSWEDAVKFCRKLSAKEGREYRLPTEAEWEYACRAGSETLYCFGDDDSDLRAYAWYWENAFDEEYAHAVGLKRANTWGLFDMHGNVWEWCEDYYGADYYRDSPLADPMGPSTGSRRVRRGGSWNVHPWGCRSAYRDGYPPGRSSSFIGFRVVQDPAE